MNQKIVWVIRSFIVLFILTVFGFLFVILFTDNKILVAKEKPVVDNIEIKPDLSQSSTSTNIIKDIAYATESPAQKLDLYLPQGVTGKIPLIIDIHGGAFKMGDKFPSMNGNRFVQQGYAVAAVNHRLSGEAIFPAAVNDVKSAVRWLRANADKYNLDVDNFGAIGGSSGGNLVSFLGTAGDVRDFDVGDNLSYSSAVQAVVDQFGPVNFSTLAEDRIKNNFKANNVEVIYLGCEAYPAPCANNVKASPVTYITKNDPPFFIIHGEIDIQIPIDQSKNFYKSLQAAGIESSIKTVPNVGHGGKEFNNYFTEYLAFFDKYLRD
jgi:acetyl esterase/lipase